MHATDEALLLAGDLEDFGRFYDRYVKALLALAIVLDDRILALPFIDYRAAPGGIVA